MAKLSEAIRKEIVRTFSKCAYNQDGGVANVDTDGIKAAVDIVDGHLDGDFSVLDAKLNTAFKDNATDKQKELLISIVSNERKN